MIKDKLKINRKGKAEFTVRLYRTIYGRYDGPYTLENATEIILCFKPEDPEAADIEIKLSANEIQILSASGGLIFCQMIADKSKLLKVGEDLSYEATIIENNNVWNPIKVQFLEMLDVAKEIC